MFVGFIGVAFFGLGFWQAVLAIVLGNALGALTPGRPVDLGAARGARAAGAEPDGVRVCAATSCPPALNTVMAGLGWFAVNSVSGAFALATLTGMPIWLALLIIVVVEVGAGVRRPRPRAVVRALREHRARRDLHHRDDHDLPATPTSRPGDRGPQRIQLRRLHAHRGRRVRLRRRLEPLRLRLHAATCRRTPAGVKIGLGRRPRQLRLVHRADGGGCGVRDHRRARTPRRTPPTRSSSGMPTWVGDLTLVAIAVGAISANALNIYSGAMSFLAAGVRIPFTLRRAIVALGFGVLGLRRSRSSRSSPTSRHELRELPAGHRVLDRPVARRRARGPVAAPRAPRSPTFVPDDRRSTATRPASSRWSSAGVISIWLFCEPDASTRARRAQTAPESIGDITAARRVRARRRALLRCCSGVQAEARRPARRDEPAVIVGVDAADESREPTRPSGSTPPTQRSWRSPRPRRWRARRGRHPDRRGPVRRGGPTARQRAQPARAGRRRGAARRDGGVPQRRPADAATATPPWSTTLSPCWYCSGLVRQFGIGRVIVGDDRELPRRSGLARRERHRGRPWSTIPS